MVHAEADDGSDDDALKGVSVAASASGQRIDQWLWFARITKSRTLAQALIGRGKVRINREKIGRPSHLVKAGDAVTISMGPRVRVFSVRAFASRRGPATEAQALYEELTPAPDRTKPADAQPAGSANSPGTVGVALSPAAVRDTGAGRPTKRDRRAVERLRDRFRDH